MFLLYLLPMPSFACRFGGVFPASMLASCSFDSSDRHFFRRLCARKLETARSPAQAAGMGKYSIYFNHDFFKASMALLVTKGIAIQLSIWFWAALLELLLSKGTPHKAIGE